MSDEENSIEKLQNQYIEEINEKNKQIESLEKVYIYIKQEILSLNQKASYNASTVDLKTQSTQQQIMESEDQKKSKNRR